MSDTEQIGVEYSFSVPLLPPSVNHYKKPNGSGGWYRTKEANAFIEAVVYLGGRRPVFGKFYCLEVSYFIAEKSFLRFDENNFDKVAIDALAHAGIIRDDRYVTDRVMRKRPVADVREQRTCYTIRGKETP